MTDYVWFTKRDALDNEKTSRSELLKQLLTRAVKAAPTSAPDDAVALFALDDGVPAGWIWFTYGDISDYGQRLRIAAAQNLFVDPKYRGKGIGKVLIKKSLEMRIPCVYSGMSGEALPLYRILGFSFIENSQIYRAPINFAGSLRTWRNYFKGGVSPGTGNVIGATARTLRARRCGTGHPTTRWAPLGESDALQAMKAITEKHYRRFQVPWDREVLAAAIRGERKEMNAVVLIESEQHDTPRLVTVYRRGAEVRIPLTKRRIHFVDGHVNEIYPPIHDFGAAKAILQALLPQARRWGLGSLSIYAMTPALEEACKEFELDAQGHRTFAIRALGVDETLASALTNSENWWCRAMNENQIEEGAMGAAGGKAI